MTYKITVLNEEPEIPVALIERDRTEFGDVIHIGKLMLPFANMSDDEAIEMARVRWIRLAARDDIHISHAAAQALHDRRFGSGRLDT